MTIPYHLTCVLVLSFGTILCTRCFSELFFSLFLFFLFSHQSASAAKALLAMAFLLVQSASAVSGQPRPGPPLWQGEGSRQGTEEARRREQEAGRREQTARNREQEVQQKRKEAFHLHAVARHSMVHNTPEPKMTGGPAGGLNFRMR